MDFFPLYIIAYLIGSIPFGFLLVKIRGLGDIRNLGSGNIGATNVLRTGNKSLAFMTLIFDGGKGAFAIWLFRPLSEGNSLSLSYFPLLAILVGLFAILGHCFPVWLKFKGGKGVATAFGVLIAAVPWVAFVAACTWGIVAGFFRISSLAALCATAIAPIAALILYGPMPAGIVLLISALIIWRHHANIKRLMAGEEPKIGGKKKENVSESASE